MNERDIAVLELLGSPELGEDAWQVGQLWFHLPLQ